MKQKERSLSWTRTLYVLVALVLVSLALILLSQGRYLQPVESAIGTVMNPIQGAVSGVTSGAGSWIDAFSRTKELEEDNKALRTALEALTAENAQLEALKRENEQLRAMLKFQQDRPETQAVLATNIGGDPSGLKEILTIDRGSKQGLAVGMAVVSPGGILVGQVSAVKEERATVLLITDVESSIGVASQRTQSPGIMEGQWQKGGRLLVRRIPRDADVNEGDILVTSGVGGMAGSFPQGLIAGQILKVQQNDVQTDKAAEALPLAQLSSLESVLVITNGTQK